ncbi:MAG: DUF2066 domain-containing protein [Lysobacteraceae bacterium]
MRVFPRWLAGVWLLLAGFPLLAQELALYEGEVAVPSQSESDRNAALPQALAQVLVKVGGDAASAAAAADADAASLLQQYRYRQDMVRVDGVPQLRHYLIARFNQAGVQALLASGGRSALPAQRPQPILWLAIDDGSGARIVSQDAAAAVAPLTSRANQRGLRVRLPSYDELDRSIVQPHDIPGGETYAVDNASRRYGGPVLIGWLRRGEGGWIADWRLREGESDIGRWQTRDPQAATVLATGADGAADAWAQRYSQMVLSGPAGRYPVVIEGLSSARDYAGLMQMLGRQPIVRGIVPLVLVDDRLQLELELSAGVESLARLLESSGLQTETLGDAQTPSVFTRRP